MAPKALSAGLFLLAIAACGPKTDPDAEANAKLAARRAATRVRADSVRKARHVADSLELVRFAGCSDSVTTSLKKTAAGRRKLKKPLAPGATLPEIATACGSASAKLAVVAVADTASRAGKADPAKPDSAKAETRPTALKPDSLKVTTAAAAAPAPMPSVKRPAPAAAQPAQPAVAAAAAAAKAADSVRADSIQKAHETQVLRESFAYGGGARDPFSSLIKQKNAGPDLTDLQLVGVYEDLRYAANSVVVLREKKGGKRYKLRVGDQIGRLKVAQIRPKDVVFAIEDFGFERQETLSLRKQEDVTP